MNGIAKRGCLNMRNSLKRCFTTHSKSLIFRGALNVNRLRGGHEKLSTTGPEMVENLCFFSLAVEKI